MAAASIQGDHERIFDLFRRSGVQDQPGEGIGLAHVRAWLIASAVRSTCESRIGPGRDLPRQPADSLPRGSRGTRHEQSATVNIVMIEDDEGHARLIEKNIRRAGISNDIHHFTDGTSALDYLFNAAEGPTHNGPALILLDLNLPDMSGTDILSKIKARAARSSAPRGGPDHDRRQMEIQRCYDLGCNVYITKPVNYESFADAIRQLGLFLSVIQVPGRRRGVDERHAAPPHSLYRRRRWSRRLVQRALRGAGFRVEPRRRRRRGRRLARRHPVRSGRRRSLYARARTG
jgi:CheY-like chemotaxis protein